ncbi:MAG: hypothetical protein ACKOYM_02100 [Actinomycetes bacterium]
MHRASRLIPPPAPTTAPPLRLPPPPHAPLLLDTVSRVPGPIDRPEIIGFVFVEQGVDVHVAGLPQDPRCAAAGMFGFEAPDHWCGIGIRCTGTAQPVGIDHDHRSDVETSGAATATLVVDRNGAVAAAVDLPPHGPVDPGPPSGLLVDALHRALGLPAPGTAPDPSQLILGIWLDELLEVSAAHGAPSWAEAVRLHPAAPCTGRIPASPEAVAEATLRLLDGRTWSKFRQDALDGTFPTPDLSVGEIAWMDDTMFARWVTSSLPEPATVAATLSGTGATEAAVGVCAVLSAVRARWSEPPAPTI